MQKIPQAEFKVMKFIWNKNDIVTSKEVIEAIEQDCNWKSTTTIEQKKSFFIEWEKETFSNTLRQYLII
ncbi:TPA: BlaI/MecI/CopY family transcriptional regulator [Clostridioides difficile]|nr:BlaI/MecI/CopY family transcriptional regulator [Clostridioides difficile]